MSELVNRPQQLFLWNSARIQYIYRRLISLFSVFQNSFYFPNYERSNLYLYSSAYEEVTNFNNDYRFDLGVDKGCGTVEVGAGGAKRCGRLLCSNLKLPQSSWIQFSTVSVFVCFCVLHFAILLHCETVRLTFETFWLDGLLQQGTVFWTVLVVCRCSLWNTYWRKSAVSCCKVKAPTRR